ncbi:MAG: flagellar basal-body rod protein FlgG [Nitrospirae bacterium]|nr:flagellar basal-body rod protein FlgG [Nitrospirota bacterium]
MFRSLFTAATGMQAQQLMVDVISNNIANVNTTGFKASRAQFQDLLYQQDRSPGAPSETGMQVPAGIQVGLGVRPAAVQKLFTQGDFINTGNSLDLVIQGDGFFQMSRPDGTIAYTKAGAFSLDKDGRIVNPDGYPIEPPINIPTTATSVTVAFNGDVNVLTSGQTAPTLVGSIQLARFINPSGLQAIGKNLFLATDASGDPITGAPDSQGFGDIAQGYLENSNVNIVQELANLITAQRAFDLNSKAVQASDQMLQTTSAMKA